MGPWSARFEVRSRVGRYLGGVITLGIDLAAEPKKTGVAWIEWGPGHARVTDVQVGADDDELVSAMVRADKSGIDCPLGWPTKFIDFVTQHGEERLIVPDGDAKEWRRALSYRETDLWVKSRIPGIQGLSVSSDRIGVTTMRCAALLSQLTGRGLPVDRAGTGPIVEVYPAASLAVWGYAHRGYKGLKGRAGRCSLVDTLMAAEGWLDLGIFEGLCRQSDDALDAVLAGLTARASATGQVHAIPSSKLDSAQREGWIALPDGPPQQLAH